jgi:chemotaxis protein MotB
MSEMLRNRSREQIEEVDSEGNWAISYGDMVTLLLTFFILFFNIDKREIEQRLNIQDTLLQQLKASKHPEIAIGKQSTPSIDEQEIQNWGGKVYKYGERILIEFPETSFFKKGETDVIKDAAGKLVHFAKLYQPYMGQNVLSIKAFTDTLKVSQGHRYQDNLELSALRAISAMRVLEKGGIPLYLMRISGHGELKSVERSIAEAMDKSKGDPLSRKVVLMIEPLTKDKL